VVIVRPEKVSPIPLSSIIVFLKSIVSKVDSIILNKLLILSCTYFSIWIIDQIIKYLQLINQIIKQEKRGKNH